MVTFYHLSNEQKPGCSGYIGDEILPSSMGIAISHYKHPVMNQPVWWDIIIVLKFWTLLGCGEHFTWKHGYIQLHHCSLHGCICRPAHRPKRPKPKTRWWFQCFSNFHPYLGRIPILTSIFQMGWNHQPESTLLVKMSYTEEFLLLLPLKMNRYRRFLLGTIWSDFLRGYISHLKALLKMIFPFPKVQYVTRWAPLPVTNGVISYNLYKRPKINE